MDDIIVSPLRSTAIIIMESQSKGVKVVKVAMVGNVDSGKTTLVGVLSKGLMDDGRGQARLRVFNYPHEAQNGRTSSIAQEIMGFSQGKQVLPERYVQNKNKYWAEIMRHSDKVVNFLDLCGHEKYLKTTMYGLVGMCPDYSMIVVGANMGVARMTKEHLGITLALKLPFFIVLTKVDLCPDNIMKQNLEVLTKILKSPLIKKLPIVIRTKEDLQKVVEVNKEHKVCPIFIVSNVTGQGVDLLTAYFSSLDNRTYLPNEIGSPQAPFQFDLNDNFMVPGVGIVVSGLLKAGTALPNKPVLLGPDRNNLFRQVVIKSIHVNRLNMEEAYPGQFACLQIKSKATDQKLQRKDFRKGMFLLDPALKPESCWYFEAEILVLHHSTTIKEGYQCQLHCRVIRQSVNIEHIHKGDNLMRTGDVGRVIFKFMYNSEYIRLEDTIILREGRTKLQGKVVKVHQQGLPPEVLKKKEEKKEEKEKEKEKEKEEEEETAQ